MLSEIAHDLITLRVRIVSPGSMPTSINLLALEAQRPTTVAAPESIGVSCALDSKHDVAQVRMVFLRDGVPGRHNVSRL
jgi:hypothetical protein